MMANPPSNAPGPPNNGRPKASKEGSGRPQWRPQPWWLIFLVVMIANYVATQVFFPEPSSITIPYTFFKKQVEAGNVEDVTSVGDSIQGTFKTKVTYPPQESGAPAGNAPAPPSADQPKPRTSMQFKTQRPAFADQGLEKRLEEKGVVIKAEDEDGLSWFKLLVGFGPTLLLIGAFVWISRRAAAAAGGGLFGLGRSRAKRYSEEQPKVTFDDVAGIDEAENELIEIVDFLKNPAKYQRLGGTVPKGVLLVGAPGTGKTLLARAIAGQAGVPFFSLSASEFIEMIVGVGASRVRDLFKQAREAAPAIIFIDELDAIGRTRGSGAQLGGHDEREQTLNQILTEMDGFDSREGVIVLAATNRADVLDLALLRPGRFDRRVVVQRPDRAGRAAILKVHTKNVPLAPDVSLERIAAETPGLVGAELRNLVNEAALLAARKDASCGARRGFRRGAGEDHPRAGPQHSAQPGGSGAHRLPRGGTRAARAAGAGQRPGAPRLDRAARHGAGSDLSTSRRRSDQLRRRLSAGAYHQRTRRPRGREARLRCGHERRRERPPAGHRDRPSHGVALGDEREARPDQLCRAPGRGSAAGLPAPALQRGDLGADRRRSPPHRRGEPP